MDTQPSSPLHPFRGLHLKENSGFKKSLKKSSERKKTKENLCNMNAHHSWHTSTNTKKTFSAVPLSTVTMERNNGRSTAHSSQVPAAMSQYLMKNFKKKLREERALAQSTRTVPNMFHWKKKIAKNLSNPFRGRRPFKKKSETTRLGLQSLLLSGMHSCSLLPSGKAVGRKEKKALLVRVHASYEERDITRRG